MAAVRRRIFDALLFASGGVVVVSVLVATDYRVRERASMLIGSGRPLFGLADLGARAGELVRIVSHVVLRFGTEHSMVTIFAVVAAVLVWAVLWL